MSNKSTNLLQHSYAIMVNDEADYQPINVNEDIILSNDYESVDINEPEQSSYDEHENDQVVEEIYDTVNNEISNNVWQNSNAIRHLIFCWSRLREKFVMCPDKKKKSLWQNVSELMAECGFYIDAHKCQIKWRNLKKIYMYNKTRTINKDGTKHIIIWEHYCDMDKAIKGIPYEISDIDDDDDDDDEDEDEDDDDNDDDDDDNNKEYSVHKCISTGMEYENTAEKDIYRWQWTVDSTNELIRLYGKERSKFSSVSQGGKHLLWEDIAQQLSNLGYPCSASSCNDKWRNLQMTYRRNRERVLKYGTGYVKWLHFKEMDNIMNSTDDSSEHSNVITVSLIDEIDIKRETQESYAVNLQTPQNVNIIEINENNDGEETLGNSLEVWTEAATKRLIDLWGIYRPRFLMAPQGKKRLLWNNISDELRQNGHNYSGLVCDRKWRLLKANYLKRKEKYKKLGVNSVKWQYYHDLDKLLGKPSETVSWNMDSTMCLIDCFERYKEKFMTAATGEKLLIWKEISEEMSRNGYNYSPRSCDNKWRTLKNRYHKNKIRANRKKKVIWVYYNRIDSVLRENKEKYPKHNEIHNSEVDNPSYKSNEMGEHNYIKTSRQDCTVQLQAVTELKDLLKTRNVEFDQRLREMEDNINNKAKVFEELQQQTLEALKRSNRLEAQKLKLLKQLVSRLPSQT